MRDWNKELPVSLLKEYLDYDPDTGEFRWLKVLPKSNKKVGKIAGCLDATHGYILIGFCGTQIRAHRLAYAFKLGCWPDFEEAHAAYLDAARSHFGEFACGA